ncbi:MAG: NADH-quinone oxidoreductase subunit NuoE [Rhodobiaceae bacterium]|nr:NADH-quinone oxidoreductase subunit NuoE [Rhodobiaceae bacterium]
MAVRRLAEIQPDSFVFTDENRQWAEAQIKKFPEGRQASAVIPLLWRAQEQHDGWLPEPAIRHVADILGMAHIRVLEIATFYSMFNLSPVGEHFVQLCGTTPCRLRGAEDIIAVCERVIGPQGTVTADGKFSWLEVECLGACCNAPMVQINKDYYEDLTPESFEKLLNDLRDGKPVKPGPQNGRRVSEPVKGPKTLTDPSLYNNRRTLVANADVAPAAANDAGAPAPAPAAPPPPAPEKPAEAKAEPEKAPAATVTPAPAGGDAKAAMLVSEDRPEALTEPAGGTADDLKRISGIGPKIEGTLNGLGIFHFAQIARWSDANKAWVDGYLSFKGRIDRENWIGQAATLAEGGETDFSKRVDDGDVPSSKG